MELRIYPYFLFILLGFHLQSSTAKPIFQTLPTLSQLSHLESLIQNSTSFSAQLGNADNFTFVAPTDTALQKYLAGLQDEPTQQDIDALLRYHLLKGVHPVSSFSTTPQFVHSLENETDIAHTNVSAGQVVELIMNVSKEPIFMSGNGTNSSITMQDIEVTGGLIQIVDTVFSLPASEAVVVGDAQLSFFIGLLAQAGFFSNESDALTTAIVNMPDTTYFAPNTASALAQFPTGANQSTLVGIFEYHIVPGFVGYSTELRDGMQLRSVQGSNLSIRVEGDGTRWVNDARILKSDLLVANGVLHTIDTLLDPRNITHAPVPSSHITTLTPGAIAGLTIGILFFLFLIALLVFYLFKRHRNRTYNRTGSISGAGSNPFTRPWRTRRTMTQLSSSSPSSPSAVRRQISRPRIDTGWSFSNSGAGAGSSGGGSGTSPTPLINTISHPRSTRNNSDATTVTVTTPFQHSHRTFSPVSSSTTRPIIEMPVPPLPPAELDAVRTRIGRRSYETEIHELSAACRSSGATSVPRVLSTSKDNKMVRDQKIIDEEGKWERYPAERYEYRGATTIPLGGDDQEEGGGGGGGAKRREVVGYV